MTELEGAVEELAVEDQKAGTDVGGQPRWVFDAEAWVQAFESAGARYVTITAKHHDGFAMYDSAVSDYDIVDRTPYDLAIQGTGSNTLWATYTTGAEVPP